MKNVKGKVLVIIMTILVMASTSALADNSQQEHPSTAMKVVDLVMIRPLSIVVSTACTAVFIGSLPLTFPAGVSEPAARILVEFPWKFTGARYLGDFHHYKDGEPIALVADEK
jgi:hypothetical protein